MQVIKHIFVVCFLGLAGLCFHQQIHAQCTSPINTFPYTETFEANNGNFTPSSNTHWQWGAIVPGTKNVITAAGAGQKCWIVGGLSGALYNQGNSYLQTPCFDFS